MGSFARNIAPFVDQELRHAHAAGLAGQSALEFSHLERAHILGQASTYQHVRVHLRMLQWGVRHRRPREVLGQILRVFGAATMTGIGFVPEGNTGGANVSALKPMAVPQDLSAMIRQARPGYRVEGIRMSNRQQFLDYLGHYAAKRLDRVSALFADDISLRDWNISVSGKEAALAETARNFRAASIEIHVLGIFEAADAIAGELRILVDGHIELFVVDVVSFDPQGRISAIRAYLGKGPTAGS